MAIDVLAFAQPHGADGQQPDPKEFANHRFRPTPCEGQPHRPGPSVRSESAEKYANLSRRKMTRERVGFRTAIGENLFERIETIAFQFAERARGRGGEIGQRFYLGEGSACTRSGTAPISAPAKSLNNSTDCLRSRMPSTSTRRRSPAGKPSHCRPSSVTVRRAGFIPTSAASPNVRTVGANGAHAALRVEIESAFYPLRQRPNPGFDFPYGFCEEFVVVGSQGWRIGGAGNQQRRCVFHKE